MLFLSVSIGIIHKIKWMVMLCQAMVWMRWDGTPTWIWCWRFYCKIWCQNCSNLNQLCCHWNCEGSTEQNQLKKTEENRMNELFVSLAQKLILNQDDQVDGVDDEETVKWVCDLLSLLFLSSFGFLYHFFLLFFI